MKISAVQSGLFKDVCACMDAAALLVVTHFRKAEGNPGVCRSRSYRERRGGLESCARLSRMSL